MYIIAEILAKYLASLSKTLARKILIVSLCSVFPAEAASRMANWAKGSYS